MTDKDLFGEDVEQAFNNEIACTFYALFHTENGKKVIEHLKKMTIERGSFPQAAQDGVMAAMLMSVREGENNLLRQIEVLIRTGEREVNDRGTS